MTKINYIYELISEGPTDSSDTFPKPAVTHLLETRDDLQRLETNCATLFLLQVAIDPFLSRHTRSNTQLAVAFSCTRVHERDEQG